MPCEFYLVDNRDDNQVHEDIIKIDASIINSRVSYTYGMPYRDKGNKPGPKSVFDASLGKGVNIGHTLPMPIHELIREAPWRRLMNKSALDNEFKNRLYAQLPEEDPPEPE